MMMSYSHFGDVVCFDTTCKKNKAGRPFGMFLGVNHHKQTTIFGAALLYDETAETFMWLFETFITAMSGKKPKTILTDQDAAMAKALTIVWPETHHRLCIWHIYQNAAKNLSGVFERFREFAKDLSECIYEYEEEDEFLDAWEMMLEKYNLKSNEWLIEDRRYEELTYDFKATQSFLKLSVNIEILKHASSIYTPAVFKMFQVELGKAYDCVLSICGDDGMLTKYKVTHHKRRFHHSVEFNSSNDTVICSCKKFEFSGILCSHALKVLSSKNVLKIPTQYILKRWTKYAKHGEREVVSKSSLNEDAKASMAKRYRDLCRLQTQVATKAAMTEQTYEIAMNSLYKVIEDVEAHMR
ncbi:hypothetical protein LWI29_020141 [Acer saccharum]|uniref:Protein FAR1-RELATED SEQUENCE n=1 Tax=Acer saccharum TaxID=4024 RepID=A0AA39RVK6_ACESA|nr:hypothetical protein LWI29_020141 [Acer saccharum]